MMQVPAAALPAELEQQVSAALREDGAGADVTANLVPARQRVRGRVITLEQGLPGDFRAAFILSMLVLFHMESR